MNISGLIRNLIGDLQASDSKVLELKVGQVVRGVVLQLLSDQDALININGTQVRAKLETPLKQGDVTMLQVQPESSGGQVVLKPLTASGVQIADESLGDLLKSFALKDAPANRQLVQQLQQEAVPLTKETAQAFAAVMQEAPEGAGKDQWLQAAVLAFKKGLPLTRETVGALRQATSGPPMGDVFERLEEQASALLKEQPEHGAAATLTQLTSALKELRSAAAAAWTARPPQPTGAAEPAPPASPGEAEAPAAAAQRPTGGAPAAPGSAAAGAATPAAEPDAAPGSASPGAAGPRPPAEGAGEAAARPRSGAPAVGGEPRPRGGSPLQPPEPGPGQAPAAARSEAARHAASPEAARGGAEAAGRQAPADSPEPAANWLVRLLKAVGVEHEHQLAKLAGRPDAGPERQLKEALELPLSVQLGPGDASDDAARPAADSLKSLLLQLTSADDVPAALKDTAQQALQQVTGQQLLLTSDKTAMFSHMTLFIPFMDGSGQQSAAVHIQSRKGKRGEMDADNCRLLFDLQMKALGSTLVDVQVVNRIVSLHVHNDHPAVAELIEGSRDEVAAAMNKAGFQFLSLKCSPFPDLRAAKETDAAQGRPTDGTKVDPRSFYQPKTYKGVDYRA